MRAISSVDVAGLQAHTKLIEHHLNAQQSREQAAQDKQSIDNIHDEMDRY